MSAVIDRKRDFLVPVEQSRYSIEEFNTVLRHAYSKEASDIYVKTNRPITARALGRIVHLTRRPLEHAEVGAITNGLYGAETAILTIRGGTPIDNSYQLKIDRYTNFRYRWCGTGCLVRGNFGIEIVMRHLPEDFKPLDESQIDGRLLDGMYPDDGLGLVCGATGAGKSTLLAQLIRRKAEQPDADCRIVTFEDPAEFSFDQIETESCEIIQSQIGDHVADFPKAIRNALRRDPDIIMIGESRDAETIKASVLAAQTGHAVYSTLHANSVQTAFLRLVQALPVEELHSIMGSVLDAIRFVVCQKLVPSLDGRRVPVREWVVFTKEMRSRLLTAASRNISLLPAEAGRLVEEFGVTKVRHAEQLRDQGLIDGVYVDLIRAESEAERAQILGDGSDGEGARG
ncbi:type IV pilus twitching motility protein PilT [Paraburkholderia sediminicola]|uniref:type IV pilus twitching motility protein PilT n=1 Tax=Paraburkholderia sediminicola TaxID=458836 RepID=UPI0038B7B8CB